MVVNFVLNPAVISQQSVVGLISEWTSPSNFQHLELQLKTLLLTSVHLLISVLSTSKSQNLVKYPINIPTPAKIEG